MSDKIVQAANRVLAFVEADMSDRAEPRAVVAQTRIGTGSSADVDLLTADLILLASLALINKTN